MRDAAARPGGWGMVQHLAAETSQLVQLVLQLSDDVEVVECGADARASEERDHHVGGGEEASRERRFGTNKGRSLVKVGANAGGVGECHEAHGGEGSVRNAVETV